MSIIGGILVFVGGIICLICYIMAIVKAFKAGETLWGVLSIFIGICGLIYLFMRGHKKLGLIYIVGIVLMIIGYGMFLPAMMSQMQELQTTPELQGSELQPAPLPQ
jgi:uncharacterized membrane protein HdeD (DUF308 family)